MDEQEELAPEIKISLKAYGELKLAEYKLNEIVNNNTTMICTPVYEYSSRAETHGYWLNDTEKLKAWIFHNDEEISKAFKESLSSKQAMVRMKEDKISELRIRIDRDRAYHNGEMTAFENRGFWARVFNLNVKTE